MIDLQNECHVGNGIMPGLGELHHRYPILKFFCASTRKHPSMVNDSYVDFCCFQRTTHSMKRKRCRSSFSRSPKVERNISLPGIHQQKNFLWNLQQCVDSNSSAKQISKLQLCFYRRNRKFLFFAVTSLKLDFLKMY